MTARRLNVILIIALGFSCFQSTKVMAGWFNYDSFEDCMLGEMKNQAEGMKYIAQTKCRDLFPVKKPNLEQIQPSDIEFSLKNYKLAVTRNSSGLIPKQLDLYYFDNEKCAVAWNEDGYFSGGKKLLTVELPFNGSVLFDGEWRLIAGVQPFINERGKFIGNEEFDKYASSCVVIKNVRGVRN